MSSASNAEYLIYLKGGHFIVADGCSLSAPRSIADTPERDERVSPPENCTQEKPQEGRIFWSTINGNVGEVNADDVYAILGAKTVPPGKPSGSTTPLEDYLITNRGQSFVNAKVVEERDVEIYASKRDEPAKVNRRGIIEIVPERLAKGRSGEGLCAGEPIEFAVSEIEIVDGHLLGVITNLSKTAWNPWIDVEVFIRGSRRGKFQIEDQGGHAPLPNTLKSDESISIDQPVPTRLLKEVERLKDAEAGVRLCYRKIRTKAELSTK
jgi:hypothetical protein